VKKTLLHASVNRDWSHVRKGMNLENCILIGDAEKNIHRNLACKKRQLVHAVKDSLYKLWAEGMNKQERETVSVKMTHLLYTLVNSVKHLEDNNHEALKRRIESTVKGFINLAMELKMKG
jgi:hypothetical protein